MVSPQSDDEQFEFYLKFAKPLVLNLPDTNDRIKAAAWIRKLKDETNNATLRTDYLKLLLFVLQRRKLIGPFGSIPDDGRPLQPFPEEINLQDVAKNFVQIDKKVLQEAIEKGGFGEWPAYNVACSSDLKEYAASQEIPNFGVHVYFALSSDPLQAWNQMNKAIFPIGEKIDTTKDFALNTNISPNISSFVPQEQTSSPAETLPQKDEEGDGPPGISDRKDTVLAPSESNPFDVETNITPTWGSNLMKVNNTAFAEDFEEIDAFDFDVSNRNMLDLIDEDIDLDEVEGISDIEDSFYLQGDKLMSPARTPTTSPAPSLPYKTPPKPSMTIPAPSLSYRTPPKPGTPPAELFRSPDQYDVNKVDMLDYMDESMELIEDMSFEDATMYLQTDRLMTPPQPKPCQPCGSPSPIKQVPSPASSTPYRTPPSQERTQPSPAPSLPYRTPPIPTVSPPCSTPTSSYRTPPRSTTHTYTTFDSPDQYDTTKTDMLDYMDESMELIEDMSFEDATMYLQSDRLMTPPQPKPCQPCGSPSPTKQVPSPASSIPYRTPPLQARTQPSPAPSLPYRTPPVPTVSLPSSTPSSSYRTPPRSTTHTYTTFDSLDQYDITKMDMLDYMDQSVELVEDISFEDATMYVQSDRRMTPPKHQPCQPCKSDRPSKPMSERTQPGVRDKTPPRPVERSARSPPQPCQPCGSSQYTARLGRTEEEELKRLEREIFDDIKLHDPMYDSPRQAIPTKPFYREKSPVQKSEYIKKMKILEEQLNTSTEALGGDSFIAPESKDFRWLADVAPGPGLPENVEQDPELWESFGWWTGDPDEIFDYLPPTPKDYGSPDRYAEERERWADVPATPPIFSRDPQIQTGPGAQRIYGVEEFGMESFEEPVWTSAEQYLKYMPQSPYQDPRQVDRKTLDMAQYSRSPELRTQIFDIQGVPYTEQYFDVEQAPIDDINISFNEADFQKMTRAQATFEAMQHGPIYIGAPPSPPFPPPEDQVQLEEAMADVNFLAKTPPKFMFEPQFVSTPPEYQPNIDINAEDLDESISKYLEDEMKIIQSNIPVTTPQRSPSPKRKQRFLGDDTLPSMHEVDLDVDTITSSPELKTPPKYEATPGKEINWDTEIGEPRKLSPLKPAYLGIPDNVRQAKNVQRKKELAKIYQDRFASPPLAKSPERLPHLIDEPIPTALMSPLPPAKLPPPGWKWKTPPKYETPDYEPHVIRTPTGVSPPKKMSQGVTMFYESPPQGIYSPPLSPTSALGALQFSPPAHFDSSPSPVRSPGGRPIFSSWQPTETIDDIDMEEVFPTEFENFFDAEEPQFYTSPERCKTPESFKAIQKELDEKTANLSPKSTKEFYDAEIEALENAIFNEPSTPCGSCDKMQSSESPVTPEHERRIWKESLKLHDFDEYWKRQWVVRPKPGKSKAIKRFTVGSRLRKISDQGEPLSPVSHKIGKGKGKGKRQRKTKSPDIVSNKAYVEEMDAEENYKQYLAAAANTEAKIKSAKKAEDDAQQRQARQREAQRQVMQDIADLSKIRPPSPPNKKRYLYINPNTDMRYIESIEQEEREIEAMIQQRKLKENIKERIRSQFASPPRMFSPEPIVHPFDEPLPEELDLPTALLPPSGWTWQTPPKYKLPDHTPGVIRTPTGITSPKKFTKDVTMFYESPPHELLSPPSPSGAVSALQHTPTYGFDLPSSPIRSPGGRPIIENWQIDNIADEIDLEKVFPTEFEDIFEEETPSLYMSPPKFADSRKIGQEIEMHFTKPPKEPITPRITNRPLSPATPEPEKELWKENLKLHELHEYGKKQWTVRPKPGKSRKVKRFTPRSILHTISDEHEQSPQKTPTLINDESMDAWENIEVETACNDRISRESKQKAKMQREVMQDIADLPQVKQRTPPKSYFVYKNPNIDPEYLEKLIEEAEELEYMIEKAILKQEIAKRVRKQFASPPRMPSPEPIVHPFDEPLPTEAELPPALLPPSGWTWKTPPKYKLPEYTVIEKRTPTGISLIKPFSEEVSIFYESPPRDLLSPTSPSTATSAFQSTHPQGFGHSPISPIRPPGSKPVTEAWQFEGIEDDIDFENVFPTEFTYIDQEEHPELYMSPTKAESPGMIRQEKTTTKIQYSPETPENKRKLWEDSLKLHQIDKQEQYPKKQWVVLPKPSKKVKIPRYARKPKLQTISDAKEPTPPHKTQQDIIKAEKCVQQSRKIYEEAQKQAMQDIMKLQELRQSIISKKSQLYQSSPIEDKKTKLKEEIARRVREQFASPPRAVSPEPVIHPLDEDLPPDLELPPALLPPSGWSWKTPPHLKQQPYEPRKIVTPTGINPQRIYDPESLFYESPPQSPPEEDLDTTVCSPCSPLEAYDSIYTDNYIRSPTKSPIKLPTKTSPLLPSRSTVSPIQTQISPPLRSPDYCPLLQTIDGFSEYENIYKELPPAELSRLPSPPSSFQPEQLSPEEYKLLIENETKAMDNAMMKSNKQKATTAPCSPITPEHVRKVWQEELALRTPLELPKRTWVVKPTHGRSYRVQKSKQPRISPIKERYLEWSPEVVYDPPVVSPRITTRERQSPITTPERQIPPENWVWKTPSPQTLKATRQRLIEEGTIPFPMLPDDLISSSGIFSESPPYIPQTPPDTSPIDVCSPCTGISPDLYYSPESESPFLSPDITPYRSPLRSPGGRPIIPEWVQEQDDHFYFDEILANQYEFVDEEVPPQYVDPLPPSPPPLPAAPRPYIHQIKLTPRTRPKPDISLFSPEQSPTRSTDMTYQSLASPCRPCQAQPTRRGRTPESAKKQYEPFPEAIRFEPKRPTPQPVPVSDYNTPNVKQFRGGRRRQVNKEAARRRLFFQDDEEMEDEFEDIQNLQRAMEESIPTDRIKGVDVESPPRDTFDAADISMFSDVDYEPEGFNLYEDEDIEEYNVRLPFEGQRYTAPGSPIPVTEEIPEEQRDFKWMQCDSSCFGTPKR